MHNVNWVCVPAASSRAAGIAHFTAHDEFCTMMPEQVGYMSLFLPTSNILIAIVHNVVASACSFCTALSLVDAHRVCALNRRCMYRSII